MTGLKTNATVSNDVAFDPYDLDAALLSGKPIYVINNTEPRGLLLCKVNDPTSGRPHNLEFYRTWIPFCLTEMLPVNAIAESIELRQYFRRRLLKLMRPSEAETLLKTPKAVKEYDRLVKSEFSQGASGDRKKGLMIAAEQARQAIGAEGPQNVPQQEGGPQLQVAHPKLQTLEQRVAMKELDGPSVISELEIDSSAWTLEDLQFLLVGKFPQEVRDWAIDAMKAGQFRKESPIAQSPATPGLNLRDGVKALEQNYEADWS